MQMNRRALLRAGVAAASVVALSLSAWRNALAGSALGPSPYGELGAADAFGLRLPSGFTARCIAESGQLVPGTGYVWHIAPDGAATFATTDGGWIYVSNSEDNGARGGAGALRFDASGNVINAYPILSGTKYNCAGGATPWGTWLSCEEFRNGRVWECDPSGRRQATVHTAMGTFAHEAAVVDPRTGYVYLTEDDGNSRFYRFRPIVFGDLRFGTLEAAAVAGDGSVRWKAVSEKQPARDRDTSVFNRGEGAWFSEGVVYFCTTGDNRVWALTLNGGGPGQDRMEILYDAALLGVDAPLREPDNITVHARSGDIYCGEDSDDLQLVLLANANGTRIAAPFMQLVGHDNSEVTGPTFSPDGSRLYVTSQRGTGRLYSSPGMVFEITGPFRR